MARIAADEGDAATTEALLERVEGLGDGDIAPDFAAQIAFCRAQLRFAEDPAGARAMVEAAIPDYPQWKLARNSRDYLRAWLDAHPAP